MIELFRNPGYNFIGKRHWAYLASGLFTLIALISLVTQGLRYDIDFLGGALMQVRFEQTPDVGRIRSALSTIGLGESIIQQFGDPHEFILRMHLQDAS
ncbi:MAG: protein translocase subunit SecF, partial [Candidatus Rokuibacteriota bacterium]